MPQISWIKKWPNRPLVFAGAAGLIVILIAAFTGVIQHFFNSEDFYVLHYANNYSFFQAIAYSFQQNGRLIEGIFWTFEYKLIGFNPLAEHSLSFVLLLIVAVFASGCFLNIWPGENRNRKLPYLFVFLFFFNWVSSSFVFHLSYDNTRISLVFFFLAGLLLQRWASTSRTHWLLLSFVSFLLSVLTYENAAFLFPALLLLAWPLLPESKQTSARRVLLFVTLGVLSALALMIPRLAYGYTRRATSANIELATLPAQLIKAGPPIYLRFGQFLGSYLNALIGIALLVILATSAVWIIRINSRSKTMLGREIKVRWTCIFLASLWFLVFGPLPYILLGYDPGDRIYSSAVFGVFPLLLMVFEITYKKFTNIVAVLLILLFAGLGFYVMGKESILFSQGEAKLNIFFRGLIDAVPHVKPNTVFLFVDGPPLDIPGCGPSLQMLYNQDNLKCGRLSSMYVEARCPTIRHLTEIEVDCQHLSGGNWILIDMTGNTPRVLAELKPNELGLLITWESTEPLKTDYRKIVTKNLPPPSDFYMNLLWRAKVLFDNR